MTTSTTQPGAGSGLRFLGLYLVDTNVISVGARGKQAAPELIAWMDRNAVRLYISVVTVAEIEDGIAKLRREAANRKADELSLWLKTLAHLYEARILPFDLPIARVAGALLDRARKLGHAPGFADIIIAATAQIHHCTVLTRNLRHFETLGIATSNPVNALPISLP